MRRLRTGEGQGLIGDSQPVEFETRRELRRIAFKGRVIEAAFGPRGRVERVVQIAGQLVNLQQALRPVLEPDDIAECGGIALIGLLAQGPMLRGAIGLLPIRREQPEAFFIQPLAQLAQPQPVATLDLRQLLGRYPDPGIASHAPVLQRIRPHHRQPQLVSAQVGNPQPVVARLRWQIMGQFFGQVRNQPLADHPANVFTQAAINDATGNECLIGGVCLQAHATTHFKSLRVEFRWASRLTSSAAINRSTPT